MLRNLQRSTDMLKKIKSWWHNFTMSPVEKYLSTAKTHHELENMIQELTRKGIQL